MVACHDLFGARIDVILAGLSTTATSFALEKEKSDLNARLRETFIICSSSDLRSRIGGADYHNAMSDSCSFGVVARIFKKLVASYDTAKAAARAISVQKEEARWLMLWYKHEPRNQLLLDCAVMKRAPRASCGDRPTLWFEREDAHPKAVGANGRSFHKFNAARKEICEILDAKNTTTSVEIRNMRSGERAQRGVDAEDDTIVSEFLEGYDPALVLSKLLNKPLIQLSEVVGDDFGARVAARAPELFTRFMEARATTNYTLKFNEWLARPTNLDDCLPVSSIVEAMLSADAPVSYSLTRVFMLYNGTGIGMTLSALSGMKTCRAKRLIFMNLRLCAARQRIVSREAYDNSMGDYRLYFRSGTWKVFINGDAEVPGLSFDEFMETINPLRPGGPMSYQYQRKEERMSPEKAKALLEAARAAEAGNEGFLNDSKKWAGMGGGGGGDGGGGRSEPRLRKVKKEPSVRGFTALSNPEADSDSDTDSDSGSGSDSDSDDGSDSEDDEPFVRLDPSDYEEPEDDITQKKRKVQEFHRFGHVTTPNAPIIFVESHGIAYLGPFVSEEVANMCVRYAKKALRVLEKGGVSFSPSDMRDPEKKERESWYVQMRCQAQNRNSERPFERVSQVLFGMVTQKRGFFSGFEEAKPIVTNIVVLSELFEARAEKIARDEILAAEAAAAAEAAGKAAAKAARQAAQEAKSGPMPLYTTHVPLKKDYPALPFRASRTLKDAEVALTTQRQYIEELRCQRAVIEWKINYTMGPRPENPKTRWVFTRVQRPFSANMDTGLTRMFADRGAVNKNIVQGKQILQLIQLNIVALEKEKAEKEAKRVKAEEAKKAKAAEVAEKAKAAEEAKKAIPLSHTVVCGGGASIQPDADDADDAGVEDDAEVEYNAYDETGVSYEEEFDRNGR